MRQASRAPRASRTPSSFPPTKTSWAAAPPRRLPISKPQAIWPPTQMGEAQGCAARSRGDTSLEESRIILGTGSDEIFGLLSQVFLGAGDNIVQGEYGFGAYAIAARANEAEVRLAAESHHRIDVDAMLDQVNERTRLVWVANPANPTGTFLTDAEIRRLHEGLPLERGACP